MSTDKEVIERIERDIHIYKIRHEALKRNACPEEPQFCQSNRNKQLKSEVEWLRASVDTQAKAIENKDKEIERLKSRLEAITVVCRLHEEEGGS